MGTKVNPGQFDCYSNALPDEPMFILLGRDPRAPELVQLWAAKRLADIQAGFRPETDMPMVKEAFKCSDLMRHWRAANDGKWRVPPAPEREGTYILATLQQHERLEAVVKAAAREIASVCRGGGLTKADGVVTDDGFIGFADWAEKHMVAALDTAAPETVETPETPERAR